MVRGTRTSTATAPDLTLDFLSKLADLKPGQKVFSSGVGGVFPSGVLIGEVKKFEVEPLEGTATIIPSVDLSTIEDVFIVTGGRNENEKFRNSKFEIRMNRRSGGLLTGRSRCRQILSHRLRISDALPTSRIFEFRIPNRPDKRHDLPLPPPRRVPLPRRPGVHPASALWRAGHAPAARLLLRRPRRPPARHAFARLYRRIHVGRARRHPGRRWKP